MEPTEMVFRSPEKKQKRQENKLVIRGTAEIQQAGCARGSSMLSLHLP